MLDATYIQTLIERADAAANEAERLRKFYRRSHKRASELRVKQLTAALDNIAEASRPIRSTMGRLPYIRISAALEDQLRDASQRLQSERRKLSKMLP